MGIANNEVSQELLDRLKIISTTTLWTVLNRMGYPNTFMYGVVPQTSKKNFAGVAATLRTLPTRPDVVEAQRAGRANPHRESFATIKKNQVLVIDARGEHGTGVLGDIFATSILNRGGVAIVTDGAVRDLPEFESVGLPCYTPAGNAGAFNTIHIGAELNVPVQCAGILVLPGDILVGDSMGIVTIPQAVAEEVATKGREMDIQDGYSRMRVGEGVPVKEAFPLNPQRKAEYDEWRKAHPNG
jgi:regulator of RNase E activity RraA